MALTHAVLKLDRFVFSLIDKGKLFHNVSPHYSKDLFRLFVRSLGMAQFPFIEDLVLYLCLFVSGINMSERYAGPLPFRHL